MVKLARMDQDQDFVEKLCDLEIPSNIKISPSGKKVLYSTSLTWGHLKGKLPVATLWLATFGEANSSREITEGKCKDHSPTWHPLKDEFAFISDRAGNATKSAIYSMSLADIGKAIPITSEQNEQAIEKFKFSLDGKMIAFVSKDEKTEEEKQRDERKEDVQVWGQGYRYSRLRIINLETSELRTLPLDRHILDFCWISRRSKGTEELEIGFVSSENTLPDDPYRLGTDIHIVNTDLKQPKKVCSFPNKASDLCWGSTSPGDVEALYFWSATPSTKNYSDNGLYRVDSEGKIHECIHNAPEKYLDVMAVQSVNGHIITEGQRRLEDCVVQAEFGDLYCCKQDIETYDVSFTTSDGKANLAIATSDINHPMEVYSIEAQTGRKVQLSNHGESFHGQYLGTCTILSCPTPDRHQIEIDGIYLEPTTSQDSHSVGPPSEPYPTIVLIHGGPRGRVTNAFNTLYYMWTPYFLRLGYAVLLPNYRGSSGRGADFSAFSYDGVDNHAYKDIIALTQYAAEKGYADPNRLVVSGYSHGGLLTNVCAVRNGSHGHGWKFKAAITGAGISDIDTMSLTSPIGSIYQTELHNGAVPWTMTSQETSTRSASALWALKQVIEKDKVDGKTTIPPILILHGAVDESCPVSQAYGLQRALEHYALPFEMAIYPRQGHILHEQYFWIDMALRFGRFVQKYIGPGQRGSTATLPMRST